MHKRNEQYCTVNTFNHLSRNFICFEGYVLVWIVYTIFYMFRNIN
jgi:hypothetical protein